MPLMTRIRESMTKIFAIFAGVFVVYIVLDWGMDITGRKDANRSADAQMRAIEAARRTRWSVKGGLAALMPKKPKDSPSAT